MATVNLRDPLGTGKMVRDAWSLKSGPDNSAASTLPSVMTPQTTTRAPAEVQTPTIPVEQVSQPTAPVPAIDPGRTKSNLTPTIEGIKAGAASLVSAFDDYKNSPQRFRDEMIAVGNEDLAPQKDQVRVDAQLAQKEERARQLSNRIIERDRAYQEQLEALEQNPEGKLRGALNADINDLNRERSRELADLSFAYQVANGDFQAAQQVVDARIADIEADRDARMNMWTQAYEFAQDDMTESEKLEAQQAFQLQMTEMDQANWIEREQFKRQTVKMAAQNLTTPGTLTNTVATTGVMGTGEDPVPNLLLSTVGGRLLTQSEAEPLTNAKRVADGLQDLQDTLANVNTDPIIGLFRGVNPYDLRAATIDAAITQLVPQLARGTYGEVGVLTDADMARYANTLPNLTSTEAQNAAIMALTLRKVRSGFVSQLESMAAAGRDVSGFVSIYDKFNQQITSLEEQIGVLPTNTNDLDAEFEEFTSSGSTNEDGGFWKGVGRFFFGE